MSEKGTRLGRPPTITTMAICDAAVALIDREGIAGCTMRSIARDLDASPMSVYRHVADKEALLALLPDFMLEFLSQRVVLCSLPETALLEIAIGLGEVLDAHPAMSSLFARPTIGPNMQMAAEHCVTLLTTIGWQSSDAVTILRSVVAQVIGEHVTRPSAESAGYTLDAPRGTFSGPSSWGVNRLIAGIKGGPTV